MRNKMGALFIAAAMALVMAAVSAPRADQAVSASFNLPANYVASVSFDCQNHPGPSITLNEGVITFGGVKGMFTFSNNAKFTHYTDPGVTVDTAVVLDLGTPLSSPKQPSHEVDPPLVGTGVGGNPWIYVLFTDKYGNPVKKLNGDPLGWILLGRCVQGAADINLEFLNAVLAQATIAVEGGSCSNNPGPFIYFETGSLALSGVDATVAFTNNAKFTHVAKGDASVSIEIIPPDTKFVIPKQPVLGGAGGNPWVYFTFLNGEDPVWTWPGQLLGRCNKI